MDINHYHHGKSFFSDSALEAFYSFSLLALAGRKVKWGDYCSNCLLLLLH